MARGHGAALRAPAPAAAAAAAAERALLHEGVRARAAGRAAPYGRVRRELEALAHDGDLSFGEEERARMYTSTRACALRSSRHAARARDDRGRSAAERRRRRRCERASSACRHARHRHQTVDASCTARSSKCRVVNIFCSRRRMCKLAAGGCVLFAMSVQLDALPEDDAARLRARQSAPSSPLDTRRLAFKRRTAHTHGSHRAGRRLRRGRADVARRGHSSCQRTMRMLMSPSQRGAARVRRERDADGTKSRRSRGPKLHPRERERERTERRPPKEERREKRERRDERETEQSPRSPRRRRPSAAVRGRELPVRAQAPSRPASPCASSCRAVDARRARARARCPAAPPRPRPRRPRPPTAREAEADAAAARAREQSSTTLHTRAPRALAP